MRSRPLMKLMIFAVLVIAVESLDPTERGWNILAGKVKGNVALPTTASIVPEESVAAHRKPVAHRKVLSDSGPERFIEVVQKNGGTQDDCKQFADTTITDIETSVTSEQDSLGTDIGTECAERGQQEVSAAKKGVEEAEKTASSALVKKDTACAATVSVTVSLDEHAEQIFAKVRSSESYLSASQNCGPAKEAWTRADEDVNQAKLNSASAVAQAALEVSKCNCKVQKGQATKWKNAQEVTAQHAETWKQAQGVLCALDQASDNCDPEANPCPTLTKPTLAAGVDDEDCAATDTATTCYVQQDKPCKDATMITTEDDCKSAGRYLHGLSEKGMGPYAVYTHKKSSGCYFINQLNKYYFNTFMESAVSCRVGYECICKSQC